MNKPLVFSRYEGDEPDEEQKDKPDQVDNPSDALLAKF